MIPHKQERNMTAVGMGNTKQFGIEMSGKLFDMIMLKIYTDPMTAVLREIGCNANDEHIECGQTKPFTVHLPSQLEPYLEFIDFGRGLTDDQVRKIFIRVGKSTKEHQNISTGCLGVGCKSPFALSDSFTVISRQKGQATTYVCAKDERNLPTLSDIGMSTPTDMPDGLTIRVSIDPKDFYSCIKKAGIVYRMFERKPTIIGVDVDASDFDMTPLTRAASYSCGFVTSDPRAIADHGHIIAIQGGIAYPIRGVRYLENGGDPKLHAFITELAGTVVLNYDIGDVDFLPSREELDYGKRTVAAITAKYAALAAEFTTPFQESMDKTTTRWEAYDVIRAFDSVCHTRSMRPTGMYKPSDIIHIPTTDCVTDMGIACKRPDWSITIYKLDTCTNKMTRSVESGISLFYFKPDEMRIIFVDPAGQVQAKIKECMRTNNLRIVYAVAATGGKVDEVMLKALADVPVARVSTLPNPKKEPAAKGPGIFELDYYRWNKGAGSNFSAIDVSQVPDDSCVFPIKGFYTQESLDSIHSLGAKLGIRMFGVRASHIGMVSHIETLTNLRARLAATACHARYRDMIIMGADFTHERRSILNTLPALRGSKLDKLLVKNKVMVRKLEAAKLRNKNLITSIALLSTTDRGRDILEERDAFYATIEKACADIRTTYPLIAELDRGLSVSRAVEKHADDYVRMIKAPMRRDILKSASPLRTIRKDKRNRLTYNVA